MLTLLRERSPRNRRAPRHFWIALTLLCIVGAVPARALAQPAISKITVPSGAYAGMHASGPTQGSLLLRLAIEFKPHDDLDALALAMSDPASPLHRKALSPTDFIQRFGRVSAAKAYGEFLRTHGANNVFVSKDGLVVSTILSVADAEHVFNTQWVTYVDGKRNVSAPTGPLTVAAAGVRDVRGAVISTVPHLNDVRAPYTGFRGDWFRPTQFREMYDALPQGGAGQRIVLIEDASDAFDSRDIQAFLADDGAPPGADFSRLTDTRSAFKSIAQDCGRDDRGQEPALDVQATMTMAPAAQVIVSYDDVCSAGNDGTGAISRALDADPTVIVFPFSVGPVRTTVAATYGLTPLPILTAIVRGIPLVTSSGDDGALGYREPGIDRAAVTWPCVLPYVICAGGTSLGDRDGQADEAPWNDALFAGGGGISNEPRPAWQNAPGAFEFSPAFVKTRIVPDVSADAAGHLRVYWHGYGLGGVGGTSESASIVGAQLAAINAAASPVRTLVTAGDLYVLATTTPEAFRDVTLENDRRYVDNTLRPRAVPLPKDYRGIVPPPPDAIYGCQPSQSSGCTVKKGFDAVTGIGSLREKTAAAALR